MVEPALLAPPRRASAGVVDLAFEETGASARPLVLVHGYTGSRLDFLGVRNALASRRRVVSIDLRGHGDSDHRGPYTIAGAMRDLEGLLDTLGEDEVDLLGHSMGGMVALRFALARPARVRRLILMSTTAGPFQLAYVPEASPSLPARLRAQMKRRLRRDPARELARSLRAEPAERLRFEGIVRYGHARVDPDAVRGFAVDFGKMPSVADRLSRFGGPTLVLVGAHDEPFLGPSQALAQGLPHGELRVLDGAGHYPQFEAREAWLAAVQAHLEAP